MAEAEADVSLVQEIQAITATAPDLEQAAAVQIATDAAKQRGERLNDQLRSEPVPLDPALEPSVQLLESMGFSRQRAAKCLIEADGKCTHILPGAECGCGWVWVWVMPLVLSKPFHQLS